MTLMEAFIDAQNRRRIEEMQEQLQARQAQERLEEAKANDFKPQPKPEPAPVQPFNGLQPGRNVGEEWK
jgi:hypothetical protein